MSHRQTLTFAHLTDPHLTTLDRVRFSELCNKRILGYLSWRLSRRHEHRREILDALQQDLQQTAPQHLVVSGDLTHLGLPDEFDQALKWLNTLGTPDAVTVVPGNHDAYVTAPWDRTFALWWPYMAPEPPRPPDPSDPRGAFPIVRVRGPVAFIGLSSAHPSAPFLAVGSLGLGQLQRLGEALRDTGRQGLCRVVIVHHPPVPGSVPRRKHLTDARALCDVLTGEGAELVLHGHTHYTTWMELPGAGGDIPVIGIPSASAAGHKRGRHARYYLYRITPDPGQWRIEAAIRGYCAADARFVDEGHRHWSVPRDPSQGADLEDFDQSVYSEMHSG